MGAGMARNLVAAGVPLTVYDLDRAAVDGLVGDPWDVVRLYSIPPPGKTAEVNDAAGRLRYTLCPMFACFLLWLAVSGVDFFTLSAAGGGAITTVQPVSFCSAAPRSTPCTMTLAIMGS